MDTEWLERHAKTITRENFMSQISITKECPSEFGLEDINQDILCGNECSECWINAVKDIKFKGEEETMTAICINLDGIKDLTLNKKYEVEQNRYFQNYYDVMNDTGFKDSYKKYRFKIVEGKRLDNKKIEHELKILPEYFKAVREGTKTFEIRKNDRGFKVGDTLILKEYLNNSCLTGYAGQKITKEISYILEGGQYGLKEGYCILGLKHMGIELRNIELAGLSLPEELDKRDEEYKEFRNAIYEYLVDNTKVDHLKEEACDVIQVVLSILKILGIDIPEITEYWNTKHLEKLKNRPRKEE